MSLINNKKLISVVLVILQMAFSVNCLLLSKVSAKELTLRNLAVPGAKVKLFAKSDTGDHYTLFPEGLKKENAYIGGFKSAQLDPLEENIYFYDPTLKVIAKMNIESGKVQKVIGKPKSITVQDFSSPVKFSDASLGKLTDFMFDKYGNIYILYSNPSPVLLKASLKDETVKEVFKVNDYFLSSASSNGTFDLTSLSYDHDRYIYLTGNHTANGFVALKYDPLTNTGDVFIGKSGFSSIGFNPKTNLNTSSNYFKLLGLVFDHKGTCYVSSQDYQNSAWSYSTSILKSENENIVVEPFIGDGPATPSDIGDGGLAKSAYAGLIGPRSLTSDKNGDIFIADSANNRVRKIFADSGLIATVVGGGNESIEFEEQKSLDSISLQGPNTLLVDKSNVLYIVENNRVLEVTNLVTYVDKPFEKVKIANLSITKIAGKEINNPKGEIAIPDLTLDYTYSGDRAVEVTGQNIPDGTNIKLLSVNPDGTSSSGVISNGKLTSGLATIPVKIEAGTTKVIKAETDPFIPFPGVYLPGTEPQIIPGELPQEPVVSTPKRDEVNLSGNLLPINQRFNFSYGAGWIRSDNWWENNSKSNIAIDPDNAVKDGSYLDLSSFSSNVRNLVYLDTKKGAGKNLTFSVWLRTDSGNLTFPIGIGPNAASGAFNAQYYPSWLADNYLQYTPLYSYSNLTVTPTWQKFSVNSSSNITAYDKQIYLGGLGQNSNQKLYIWGARLEETP